MQKILRALIIVAMLITTWLLVMAWQKDYSGVDQSSTQNTTVTTTGDLPSVNSNADLPASSVQPKASVAASVDSQLINVSTDLYDIKINPVGGDVVFASLKDYDAKLNSNNPFVLLEENSNRVYLAQSGLVGQNGIDTAQGRAKYDYISSNYAMAEGQETLSIPLTYSKDGVTVTKTFTFTQGKYPIEVSYNINNNSANTWQGQMFAQLKRDDSKDPGMADKGALSMATFLGGAYGTPDDDYSKLKFSKFNDGELNNISTKDGWVAIIQHYFVAAWTPSDNVTAKLFSKQTENNNIIGFTSEPLTVAAGTQNTFSAKLYTGPKVQDKLENFAPGFEKTVDYGWAWPISKFLFTILSGIHSFVGNWGWAIIALTLLVKLVLFPISHKSYMSMAKMRAIAPKLQAIKDEHGDDRMAQSQAMMALYKEEKVNPMAGCLPLLAQMPIFLGLYYMLVESIELRHAPWIGWIQDLSSMDPLFILPIFMGISMFAQQMLNPQPADPMQAKVMKFMPIMFAAFMLFFPAGLVLYWTVNNLSSMAHQYYVNKKVEKAYSSTTAS
ncbi:membrane protein insertase YidC [Psychrobacter sp. HD31]|uniref:membrane protein insertase YidC n=1 Tax=Psychrobacter sp. HD31 TaxID=3112003 RepID=UPI003DA52F9B